MFKRSKLIVMFIALFAVFALSVSVASAQVLGGSLDPTTIPKYVSPLLIPPAMPQTSVLPSGIDYYEIAVRQFEQQVLPEGMPKTKVWGYGSINHPETFNYPANTIEAKVDRPVQVKWINDLKDPVTGKFLPHLLPIDQTLHWANPPKDCIDGSRQTDCRGKSQSPYAGPVPIIAHLHGAHVGPESDGFPEAWYLPAASNIPGGYARRGSRFDQIDGVPLENGAAVFQYRNDQRATALWFHDHTLGMTRANVYAGPAGFYILRGGSSDLPSFFLPSPAPRAGDPAGKKYHEIPILIQDRSFNANGSLFYPNNRAFFEGLNKPGAPEQFPGAGVLDIPFIPRRAVGGRSDVSPIWNPEFFGNTMVVNGKTWPVLEVEKMRYRFRFLNGSDSRFVILKMVTGDPTVRPATSALPFWQIGTEGGFLPDPVQLETLLIALAERADVIVDFSSLPVGTEVFLINEGPDEPFGGGVPGVDFPYADPGTTGQVMKLKVVQRKSFDLSLPPQSLPLPQLVNLGPESIVRTLSLNEDSSQTVFVTTLGDGSVVFDPTGMGELFGPTSARLGTLEGGVPVPKAWMDEITENPGLGIEIWEFYNFTADAHPIHVHQTMFQVIDREGMVIDPLTGMPVTPVQLAGSPRPREVWESGFKDTVISYPGQVTRIKVFFDIPGLYVWHCHILSHEDNEMMRPFCVGGGCM
jgi:FtsP/CotA-like multicopper oxidase with cupredoxin domain